MKLHQPVMPEAVCAGLNIKASGVYVDGTFGRGGHSRLILKHLDAQGRLFVLDRDPEAIAAARALAAEDPRVQAYHAPFSELGALYRGAKIAGPVDGILLDLGLCSTQIDTAGRGFSFQLDGPLDMRMDPSKGISAAEWINQSDASTLAEVFKKLGEERFAGRIAKAIVQARALHPIHTTHALAQIVKKAHPRWETHKHPATRVFQAIRMFINHELDELSAVLAQAVDVLNIGGRLVVISFHSLEDRIVKQFIRGSEKGVDKHLHKMPWLAPYQPVLRALGKPVQAGPLELQQNPRARSARLRVAEKISEKMDV